MKLFSSCLTFRLNLNWIYTHLYVKDKNHRKIKSYLCLSDWETDSAALIGRGRLSVRRKVSDEPVRPVWPDVFTCLWFCRRERDVRSHIVIYTYIYCIYVCYGGPEVQNTTTIIKPLQHFRKHNNELENDTFLLFSEMLLYTVYTVFILYIYLIYTNHFKTTETWNLKKQ